MNNSSNKESLDHIKDILIHLQPIIKMSGNSEATMEMLPHLAELDPLFHQMTLVQDVRKKLRDNLLPYVEKSIEKYLLENKGKPRAEPPVEHLVKMISEQNSFSTLATKYNNDMDTNLQYISKIGGTNIFNEILENDYINHKESPLNSTEQSLNSSLNQSGFLFLHPAQYNIISENLLKKDKYEGFHDALNMLLVVTPGEPVSQDAWGSIKKNLKKLLLDNDDIIFNKVLRIHIRFLTSQVHNVVVEGYFNLLEAIANFWLSRKQSKNLPNSNQISSLRNSKLFTLISVMLKFIKDFSLIWIRYPSKYTVEIIDQTLNCFISSIFPDKLSALDILAIADPQASWIYFWLHGSFGRQRVYEALSSKVTFLFSLLAKCISYLEKNDTLEEYDDKISVDTFNFIIFSHSFHFIIKIIHHVDGITLFPIYDPISQQHISIKKFTKAWQIPFKNRNKILVFTILNPLTKECLFNETFCRLLCDTGFVDFLATDIQYNDITQGNLWYYKLVLEFFLSLNNTTIGHKYILLGTLQRISLSTLITNHNGAIGANLCSLAESLLRNSVSQLLAEKSITLCLEILFSPLGKYLYFNHWIMSAVLDVLLINNCDKREHSEQNPLMIFENPTISIILNSLIHCFEGINFLDKNMFLESVLKSMLPCITDKGLLKIRLLNTVSSSRKGAKILALLPVIKYFWNIVNITVQNEITHEILSLEEDREELFAKILLPLICLASSYEGTVQLFGSNGIGECLSDFFNKMDQEEDVRKIIFFLLCTSASSLDKIIYMQKNFDIQESLLAMESTKLNEMSVAFTDKYLIMTKHIISCCMMPPEMTSNPVPFFCEKSEIIDESIEDINLVTRRGGNTKKDSWKFLNNFSNESQDTSDIVHCKRTYRLEIAANSLFKISTFWDLIDFTIINLVRSSDELLPEGLLIKGISVELSKCVSCQPPEDDTDQVLENSRNADVQSCHCSEYKFAVDIIVRYAVKLKLLTENEGQRYNMIKLSTSVHKHLLANNNSKTDWLSLLFYIMSGGYVERAWNVMVHLRSLRVGAIIWPSLYPSLVKDGPPYTMLYTGIIQAVKLLLYRDSPEIYVAYEDSFIYGTFY